jgi:hypothetical protein
MNGIKYMANKFAELFKVILTADKDESRHAAREVRKKLYSIDDERKDEMISLIVSRAPGGYKQINEDWRQENFVIAISVLYFLGNKKGHPDFLFPWLFDLMQHKRGNIRQAAIRMFEVELGPLTCHIRFPNEKFDFLDISSQEADDVLFSLYVTINDLMEDHWKPEYKRCKYISSLPTGVYKSFQLLLSRLEDLCGNEYLEKLETRQIREA